MDIAIDPQLCELLPDLTLEVFVPRECGAIVGGVVAHCFKELAHISQGLTADTIREIEHVKQTKDAYRKLGKDPNRYRPSAGSFVAPRCQRARAL